MFPVLASNTQSSGAYTISRSVRLRSSASAYFNRTPSVAGNKKLFTISAWVKRGAQGTAQDILSATSGAGGTVTWFRFNASNQLDYVEYNGSAFNANAQTAAVFRDSSAWYHVVVAYDSAQATAANRLKIYVNNVQQTLSGTLPILNTDSYINGTGAHYIGREARSAIEFFDGYLTEFNFIDGQALTPSSFGSTNATTGVWQPARYTGSYGTNGFYLNFSDNSAATAAAIGKDSSGNGNNWTPNNISVTAGVTYDSMVDVPTLNSATAANYAVLNPLWKGSNTTISNGNLYATNSTNSFNDAISTMPIISNGKSYWEITLSSLSDAYRITFGLCTPTFGPNGDPTTGNPGCGWQQNSSNTTGNFYVNNASVYSVANANSANDVFMFAYDDSTGRIYVGKNGTWFNSGNPAAGTGYVGTLTTGNTYLPIVNLNTASGTNAVYFNFGAGSGFTYTPPSGYKALNTYNLPASTVLNGGKYMAATTYTGTLLSNSITNAGSFKPDLVWVKSRSAATDHKLTDSVRGVTKALVSDSTAAETTDAQGVTAFGTAGFTVGTDTNYNNLSATYVGWQWQAGQGSTSSNTSGSITSTVSVNATAGFSVATFTGTGAAGITVGHGLGVAPAMMIVKSRGTTGNWLVYHKSLGNTGGVALEQTAAFSANAGYWNNTSPTSTVFTLGTFTPAATAVAYCWSEIAGFSKFGSYTGNGSTDGPFVYCGFRPRFIMLKSATNTGNWFIRDTSRSAYNAASAGLYPNLSDAEVAAAADYDILSNGFKVRNSSTGVNASGETIIYAAFAENPFANALAR